MVVAPVVGAVGDVVVGVVLVRDGATAVGAVDVELVGVVLDGAMAGATVVSSDCCGVGETEPFAGPAGAAVDVVGEESGVGVTAAGGGAAGATTAGTASRRNSPADGWQRSSRHSKVNERYGRRTGR